MRARWAEVLALLAVGGLAWMMQPRLDACGPGFTEAIFRDVHHPDTTWAEAVQGNLGILRPGLPENHLVVSYRRLMSLPVDAGIWNPPSAQAGEEASKPYEPMTQQWRKAMVSLFGDGAGPALDVERTTATYQWFSNVSDHAIQVALDTLHDRGRVHGTSSPEVFAWAKAQDQVFRSTPKEPRIPDPVASPEWLRMDRDYQRAAALFYSDRWDEARAAFMAISRDSHSPWRAWGGFLVARCWMRQASLGPDPESSGRWMQARIQLESLIKDPAFSAVRLEAEDYLQFVRYRLEPEVLRGEALEGLAANHSAPNWLEQLKQSTQRIGPGIAVGSPPRLSAQAEDLQAWLEVMESEKPSVEMVAGRWKATRNLPWLVAGLAVLPPGHELWPDLEAAAAKVPRSHPAWVSLNWHQTRAGLDAVSPREIPSLIPAALKESWPPWAENVIRAQGRSHALTIEQWAKWAPSRVVAVKDGYDNPGDQLDLPEGAAKRYGKDPLLLAPGVAEVLNARFPLKAWMRLIQSSELPPPLRRDVAQAAWVRAVLLGDWDAERALRAQADPALGSQIPANPANLDPSSREFRFVQIFMANPGLSPLVHVGLGRSNYGWAPLNEVVSFGTNWWCLPSPKEGTLPPAAPLFLTQSDLEASESEWNRLRRYASARHWFGRTVTAYAEAHPDDPTVPEALHRFVRITRNAECYDKDLSRLGQKAFNLLHRHYPDSPWTKKTPVYY